MTSGIARGPAFRIAIFGDPFILGRGALSPGERFMTEPVLEQTEEPAPEAEFSDELSDEALDQQEASLFCRHSPCTKGGTCINR